MNGLECIGIALMAFSLGGYFGAWLVERAIVRIIEEAMSEASSQPKGDLCHE